MKSIIDRAKQLLMFLNEERAKATLIKEGANPLQVDAAIKSGKEKLNKIIEEHNRQTGRSA